jgi:hypothetical protein
MTAFGYAMICEQSPPDQLMRDLQQAETVGFDFSVISDHYQPWLKSQGHSKAARAGRRRSAVRLYPLGPGKAVAGAAEPVTAVEVTSSG